MRIRSIKPEFWRSDDVNEMAIEDRLLFIGLWSYVDDNGVGRDQEASIVADLFAHDLSVSPHDTLTRVAGGLKRLQALGVIKRYTVENRRYIEIVNWSKHQRINRPSDPRYPRSDDNQAILSEPSVSPQSSLSAGAGEQGSRGTVSPSAADAAIEESFETWWKCYPRKIGKGQARKAFKAALKKTDLDTLTTAVEVYAESVTGKDQQYIAHPATWLNGERWDDETMPAEATPQPDIPAGLAKDIDGYTSQEYRFYEDIEEVARAKHYGHQPPPLSDFIVFPGEPATDAHINGPKRRPVRHRPDPTG